MLMALTRLLVENRRNMGTSQPGCIDCRVHCYRLFDNKKPPGQENPGGRACSGNPEWKILNKNMLKLRYNLDDLEMQLRDKGIFNLNEVEFAILEPHGQLSVLKKLSACTRHYAEFPEIDLMVPVPEESLGGANPGLIKFPALGMRYVKIGSPDP